MTRLLPLQHWGATADEISSSMVGDDLIAGDVASGTRSITIAAKPETVFDFIAQMGFGRAGWYSYDLLDNLGRRSAETVNPDWLVQAAGDAVPGGPIEFVAAVVNRPEELVLQVPSRNLPGHRLDFTLAYSVTPEGEAATRLVTRARIGIDGPAGPALERALLVGDGVMVRRQLLGLKERAEAL